MKKKNILWLISILIILIISLCGCNYNSNKEKGFKIYYNKNTVKEISVIENLVRKYEKESNRKIEIIGLDSEEDIKSYIGENKEQSIVLLDGYSFLEFINENYLRDIGYLYKEKEIREKFSVMTNSYGREKGVYNGISIMPFSLELIINKKVLDDKGVEFERNNISDAIIKLNKNGIKIYSYIKSEYTKELLITSLIANDTIIYDINETHATSSLKNKIYSIKNGQEIFEKLNYFYKEGSFKEENFIDGNEKLIELFNEGKIGAMLTTTLVADKFNPNIETVIVDKLPISNISVNAPIGMDMIITSAIGKKNRDETDRFLRFLLQPNGIEELGKENIVTGNKKGDSMLSGVQAKMAKVIHNDSEINKFFFNIISNEGVENITEEAKNVMNGKYDGMEWERVIKKTTQ
ncbi:MAG: hypothetical protein ACRC28_18205 [Clostridium sp.]|uniref:hypothetical protein n=1 Tax=Clostridium sp. TaxID=1506 RepID=UPI003F3D62E2